MLFAAALLILISFLIVEKVIHDRRLKKIPIRIHVNGTRGKTTVTRLVAARLRSAGIRTVAKTTGDRPVFIDPDGREETILRRAPSRIQEQVWFVKRAAALRAEAIVVECMALDPAIQYISESRMIRATLGVITNVRPDHFESMGENLDEVAAALGASIPERGMLVTGDGRYVDYFRAQASRKQTQVRTARPSGDGTGLFAENFAIAEAISGSLSLPAGEPEKADTRSPDVWRIGYDGKEIYFIDAFSANDVESTRQIEEALLHTHPWPRPLVALLNNRKDRPLRMRAFTSYLSGSRTYDFVALAGDHVWLAGRLLRKGGGTGRVSRLRARSARGALDEIGRCAAVSRFTVLGMGNYKGMGEDMRRLFEAEGAPCS